jgi:hypothetical protein
VILSLPNYLADLLSIAQTVPPPYLVDGLRLCPRFSNKNLKRCYPLISSLQGHVIDYDKEISCPYRRLYEKPSIPNMIVKDHIFMYDERKSTSGSRPEWVLNPSGKFYLCITIPRSFFVVLGGLLAGFKEVCIVETNLSFLSHIMKKKKDKNRNCFQESKKYWTLDYSIGFTFGSTELRAFVIWDDKVRMRCATLCPIKLDSLSHRELHTEALLQ